MTETENTELVTFTNIENSPFKIGTENGLSYVLLGMNRISEGFEKIEDAIEDAQRTDWIRIITVMGIVYEKMNEQEQFKNK